jgi:hypothetical protein
MFLSGGKNENYAEINYIISRSCYTQNNVANDEAKFMQTMEMALDKYAVLTDTSVGPVRAVLHEDTATDETWILMFTPETKHQFDQWMHTDSALSNKLQETPGCLWWSSGLCLKINILNRCYMKNTYDAFS